MQAQLFLRSWLNSKHELEIGNGNATDIIPSNSNGFDQLSGMPADLFEVKHPSKSEAA